MVDIKECTMKGTVSGTPLYEEYERGEFEMPDKMGMLREMREIIEHLNVSHCLFSSNHASNYLPIQAMFPERKQEVIDRIEGGDWTQTGVDEGLLRKHGAPIFFLIILNSKRL